MSRKTIGSGSFHTAFGAFRPLLVTRGSSISDHIPQALRNPCRRDEMDENNECERPTLLNKVPDVTVYFRIINRRRDCGGFPFH
jgi:hypothetical protein